MSKEGIVVTTLQSNKVSEANWGRLDFLTASEGTALAEFTARVPAASLERVQYRAESKEAVSLRFLRARKFEVDKSLALLAECCQLFDKYDAEGCATMGAEAAAGCDPDVLTTFYPHTQRGYDKQGRLLLWEANGCVNLHALETVVRKSGLIRYHFWTMQAQLNNLFDAGQEDALGNKVVWTTAVLDFEGLSMHHMSRAMFSHLKTMVAIDNVCYPEMLGKMVVVNAPSLASTGWKMVKGWLDARTQDKIEIVARCDVCPLLLLLQQQCRRRSDPQSPSLLPSCSGPASVTKLQELIDSDSVPVSLGGAGQEVFSAKPCTEYMAVPRGGQLERGVVLPAGKSLTVDTYVKDDCTSGIAANHHHLHLTEPSPLPSVYRLPWVVY